MDTKTKESHDLEDQLVKEQANLEKVMESLKGKPILSFVLKSSRIDRPV